MRCNTVGSKTTLDTCTIDQPEGNTTVNVDENFCIDLPIGHDVSVERADGFRRDNLISHTGVTSPQIVAEVS